jgi:hypothetical protein
MKMERVNSKRELTVESIAKEREREQYNMFKYISIRFNSCTRNKKAQTLSFADEKE